MQAAAHEYGGKCYFNYCEVANIDEFNYYSVFISARKSNRKIHIFAVLNSIIGLATVFVGLMLFFLLPLIEDTCCKEKTPVRNDFCRTLMRISQIDRCSEPQKIKFSK